tara:strand:- start:339 stop:521 length:183 start_codon:yes stop_codon:yes gene_type:complete
MTNTARLIPEVIVVDLKNARAKVQIHPTQARHPATNTDWRRIPIDGRFGPDLSRVDLAAL